MFAKNRHFIPGTYQSTVKATIKIYLCNTEYRSIRCWQVKPRNAETCVQHSQNDRHTARQSTTIGCYHFKSMCSCLAHEVVTNERTDVTVNEDGTCNSNSVHKHNKIHTKIFKYDVITLYQTMVRNACLKLARPVSKYSVVTQ